MNWKTSKQDSYLIRQIAARAALAAIHAEVNYPLREIEMDIIACHNNGCPLDFNKLLGAPEFDFAHDILGIRRHINRTTGKLERCFLPRCASPS
jgi:hypothetical protein